MVLDSLFGGFAALPGGEHFEHGGTAAGDQLAGLHSNQEAGLLSQLIDSHYGLPSHGDSERHLSTALSVLAQHSEHANESAAVDGVFTLAAKKWLPRQAPGDSSSFGIGSAGGVDPLQLQPSLNLPPEHEQSLLRNTVNAVLEQKVGAATRDVHTMDKMRDILERPQPADQAWQEAVNESFSLKGASSSHVVANPPGEQQVAEAPSLQDAAATGQHGASSSTSAPADQTGAAQQHATGVQTGSSAASSSTGPLINRLTGGQYNGQDASAAGNIAGAGAAEQHAGHQQNHNLFIWKASQHQMLAGEAKDTEPYVVVRDRGGTTGSAALQLLPMRSALAFGDNRDLWYRDAEGHIFTPDRSQIVDVDTATGDIVLKNATPGREGAGPEAWALSEDGTLTSVQGKEFLQFPGIADTFVDTRLIDPIGISSNVPDIPEHPAEFAIDDNSHHSWVAPQGAGGHHLPLSSHHGFGGGSSAALRPHPYLVVDAGGPKYIENVTLDFTDPPKEFLVSGSLDGGHSWQKVFGTDLNTSFHLKVPIHDKFSHLKITFLEPGSTTSNAAPRAEGVEGQYGVRHVALYGKQMPNAFVGGYPIFGPVGHFSFEHLSGPLPDTAKVDHLLELAKQLDVANSKLALAEERYEAQLDQSEASGGGFFGGMGREGLFGSWGSFGGGGEQGTGAGGEHDVNAVTATMAGTTAEAGLGAAKGASSLDLAGDLAGEAATGFFRTMEMSAKGLFFGTLAFLGMFRKEGEFGPDLGRRGSGASDGSSAQAEDRRIGISTGHGHASNDILSTSGRTHGAALGRAFL
eukprot:g1172.t1